MVIKNVESLKDLEIIEFLNTVVSKFGRRFLFIFEKRTGNIIATYDVQNIWVPDEVNRKILDIKGREITSLLNSVYTRSSQNSTPNSNATNLHCCQKRCCSFGISSSNASPAFQVQKSIFHQMTKPIKVTVILPLLLAISLSWNDDIHSSISGISNDLIGVIPTIGQ